MSSRKSVFLEIGGFDESFTGNSYGDDYDLALRLNRQNKHIVFDPSAWLIHLRSPSGGLRISDLNNPFTHKEKYISRCLFFLKYNKGYRYLLFKQVLRTTIFTKINLKSPLRFLAALYGFLQAFVYAYRMNKAGVRSRFLNDAD